jgi:two-component system, NarL family, response regulator LiaR
MDLESQKISVLLVEDHQVTLDGLAAWIETNGEFRVIGKTDSADEAIEMARNLLPNVTLLDLHLPGGRNIERTIQELVEAGTKVVVFSAERRKYFVDLSLRCGATAFLAKHENYHVISDVIRQAAAGTELFVSRDIRRSIRQHLTAAEKELLEMLGRGMRYDEIASSRLTSPHTVRKQCDRLQIKLSLASREELIVWAVKNGYGDSEVN